MNDQLSAPAEDVANVRCPFCDHRPVNFWYVRRGKDGRIYPVMRCSACASAFVHPYPTEEYLDAFYRGEMNSHGGQFDPVDVRKNYELVLAAERLYPNSTVDADRLAQAAERFARGKKFLDIGAGYGFFTRAATSRGFACTAIEPGGNSSAVFEMVNGFKPLQSSFDGSFATAHEGAFNVVLMSQVLEHIPSPKRVVEDIRRVLAPGGVCIIAVPHFGSFVSKVQGRRDMFIVPPEHVNFFSMAGLRTLFDAGGFDCAEAYTVSRYDRIKVAQKLRSKIAGAAAYSALALFMNASDLLNKGMFINAVFIKRSPDVGALSRSQPLRHQAS